MRARSWFLIGLLVVAVLLLVGRTATALVVDHAWFVAMDAPALFWERVIDSVVLQGGAWVLGSAFAFANLYAVRRTIADVAMQSRVANLEFTSVVPHKRLLSATIILSMVVGALLAVPMTNWTDLALVRHGLAFGEIEGILDRDLGFYVYWLPFEEALYLWTLVSVVSLTAMVLVLYALTRSLRLEGRRIAASTHVRRHLSALGALVLVLLAWSYRLDAFDLLQYGSGAEGLFLHIDHRFTLRVDWLLSAMCGLAALIVLRTGWTGQLRTAFVTLTLVLVSAIGLRHIAPTIVARTDAFGEPARRDQDYVASRALFSRRAFDVDGIRPAQGVLELPMASLPLRASLWDERTLIGGLGASLSPSRDAGVLDLDAEPDSDGEGRRADRVGSRLLHRMVDAAPMGWTMADGRIAALLVRRPVAGGEPWRVSLVDATRPAVRDSAIDPFDARPRDHMAPGRWSPLVSVGHSSSMPPRCLVSLAPRWGPPSHALRMPGRSATPPCCRRIRSMRGRCSS